MKERIIYAFEGLDGSGKTTNISRIVEELRDCGQTVCSLSSPSKSLVGTILRAHIGTLSSSQKDRYFMYDLKRTARKIPTNVDVVIWDRYIDTIYASNDQATMAGIHLAARCLPVPDRTFLLDIPPEISWQRESSVTEHPLPYNWIESKYRRYEELYKLSPERFSRIDATQPINSVHDQILQLIKEDLAKRNLK